MHHDDVVLVSHHRRIDAALRSGLRHRRPVKRLTGSRIEADEAAIAAGGKEHPLSPHETEPRMRERIVLGKLSRRTRPDEFTRLFIESVEAIAGRTVCAPRRRDPAGDDQILVDERRGCPVVREGHASEFFHHRMLPQNFSIRGQCHENPRAVLTVNITRLRIHGRRGIRIAQVNDIAQKVVEQLFPQHLPRFRIEAGHAFLQIGTLAQITHDEEPAIREHRDRLPRKIRGPQRRLRIDFHRQSLLERNTRLQRPAPVEPPRNAARLSFRGR